MNNEDKALAIVIMAGVLIILIMLGFRLDQMETTNKNLKTEAVTKGYAEWYSENPGEAPTSWRWKE